MVEPFAKTAPSTEISVGRVHLGENGKEDDSKMGNKVGRKQFGPDNEQNKAPVMMVHP